MKAYLTKQDNGSLLPSHPSDQEAFRKLKVGDSVLCDVVKIRNVGFHRKFFALINMVFENQEVYKNIDHLRKELTKAAGYYDQYINHKGNTCYEAKSISFGSMKQDDFEDLYQRFIGVVVEHFGYEEDLIKKHIEEFY